MNNSQNSYQRKVYLRKYYHDLRSQVIKKLGGRCNCCGESKEVFLTIDHISPLLTIPERRQLGMRRLKYSPSVYSAVRRSNYNKNIFQVLCYNCNCAKRTNKFCPHQILNECDNPKPVAQAAPAHAL